MPSSTKTQAKHPRRKRLVSISVSGLSPAALQRIDQRARREGRTRTNMICRLLAMALEAEEAAAHPQTN